MSRAVSAIFTVTAKICFGHNQTNSTDSIGEPALWQRAVRAQVAQITDVHASCLARWPRS
jgi:hypothetical protein